jgi:hypothetical protein
MKKFVCVIMLVLVAATSLAADELLLSFKPTVSSTYDPQPQARRLNLAAYVNSSLWVSADFGSETEVIKKDSKIWYGLGQGAVIVVTWADTITTLTALSTGQIRETNPFVKWMYKNTATAVAVTVAENIVTYYCLHELWPVSKPLFYIAVGFFVFLRGYNTINNLHNIWEVSRR